MGGEGAAVSATAGGHKSRGVTKEAGTVRSPAGAGGNVERALTPPSRRRASGRAAGGAQAAWAMARGGRSGARNVGAPWELTGATTKLCCTRVSTQPSQLLVNAAPTAHPLQLLQLWSTAGVAASAGWWCKQSLPSVAAAGANSRAASCCAACVGDWPAWRMQPPQPAASAACSGSARHNNSSRQHLKAFIPKSLSVLAGRPWRVGM